MKGLLRRFHEYLCGQRLAGSAWLVGGSVRGMLTGEAPGDIDVAFDGDALGQARAFARRDGGAFVMLDERLCTARVVKDGLNVDISRLRGNTIEEDLLRRDLTVNAMAVPISRLQMGRPTSGRELRAALIDPAGGYADLRAGVIRMVSEENLIDDPLRLLRVYRFAAALGFRIDGATSRAVRRQCRLIADVKAERVAAELRHMLSAPASYVAIKAMKACGLLFYIFPELSARAKAGALGAFKRLEKSLLSSQESPYAPHDAVLREGLIKETNKTAMLKLAALLSALGARRADRAALRLRMSNKERNFIREMLENRKKASALNPRVLTLRAARLMNGLGDGIYPLLYLVSALKGGRPFGKNILRMYVRDVRPRMSERYLTGDDLVREFGLVPSPVFKKVLLRVQDLTLMGRIESREEALKEAGRMVKRIKRT